MLCDPWIVCDRDRGSYAVLRGRFFRRRINPDRLGQDWRVGRLVDEALRVSGIGRHEHLVPGGLHQVGSPLVHGHRRHQPDTRVAMLAVVPGEEPLTEGAGLVEAAKPFREIRTILQRFELGLGEGVIVTGIGAAMCLGDAQIGKQQRHGFGGHGRAAIRMQGQLSRRDLLLSAGVGDEPLSQRCRLCRRKHPANHIPAEDIQDDVEVEVGPCHGAQEFRDVPRPHLIGGGRQEFWFLIDRMTKLVPALPDLRLFLKEAVEGPDRTVVPAFIKQGGIDGRWGLVDEAVAMQCLEHRVPLLGRQGPRGAWSWGGHRRRVLPTIEPRTGKTEGVTGWLDTDRRGQGLCGGHQLRPLSTGVSSGSPRICETFF